MWDVKLSTHCKIQLYLGFLIIFIFWSLSLPPAQTQTHNMNKRARVILKIGERFSHYFKRDRKWTETLLTWSGDLLTHGLVTSDFKARCQSLRPGGL